MIIKILSYAAGLQEMLSAKLNDMGISVESVDYSRELLPQLKDVDIMINGLGTIDKSIIDGSTRLKLIHQIGIGIDNLDIDYCNSKSIFVANIPNTNNVSVAEHTIFLMIYLTLMLLVSIFHLAIYALFSMLMYYFKQILNGW